MHARILLVDDEPAVLGLLRRIMRELAPDYDLIAVRDGTTALAQFAERPPALVITDYHMPDMDGVMLAEAIKAQAPQCPVLLMSAYPDACARAGVADFFVTKPFRLDTFREIVRTALAPLRAVSDCRSADDQTD